MNKIININLAGRLIPIDEGAYDSLTRYLSALKLYFDKEEGGDEILHDMEDRMGELFQDKIKKGSPSISKADVESIIEIMGSPQQIVEEAGAENTSEEKASGAKENASSSHSFETARRLSRSSREKVIGGVCGGIAAHFNIDPAVVRVIFALVSFAWGTGILIYILLWAILPEEDVEAHGFRRRLYRNKEQKVIGGVCSGIAAYLNIDPVWLRLVFVLPFLSGISLGIFHHYIMPFTFGGIPFLFLLYVILWIALPEANTVAEKLEMRGKKIDIKNLSDAIKNTATSFIPEKKKRNNFFTVLFKIIGFCIGGIILLVVFSIVAAMVFSFFRAGTLFYGYPLADLVTDSPIQRTVLYVSLFFVMAIPAYALIRLTVYLITGRSRKGPKWLRFCLSVLFVGSIFCLFWIIGTVANDFKVRYHKTEKLALMPIQSDTIYISQGLPEGADSNEGSEQVWEDDDWDFRFLNDTAIALENIGINIIKSPDSLFHLEIERSAYGRNTFRAKALALPLRFDYYQEGNNLYLPESLHLSAHELFRGQQIAATLMVPEGKTFYLKNVEDGFCSRRSYSYNRGHFSFEEVRNNDYDEGKYYKMSRSGKAERTDIPSTDQDDDWD